VEPFAQSPKQQLELGAVSDSILSLLCPFKSVNSMTGNPKKHVAERKAKFSLGALRGELNTQQPATKHAVH